MKIRSRQPSAYSTPGRFHTDSLPLAAYLFTHGSRLASAETDAWGTRRFAFQDNGALRTRVREFRFAAKAMIDARTFAQALDELADRANRVRRDINYDD